MPLAPGTMSPALNAGLSLLIGTVSAMETFCGQAAGARHHRVLGVVLQRGVAAAAAVALPCILVWTQAARILQALGAARLAVLYKHMLTRAGFRVSAPRQQTHVQGCSMCLEARHCTSNVDDYRLFMRPAQNAVSS